VVCERSELPLYRRSLLIAQGNIAGSDDDIHDDLLYCAYYKADDAFCMNSTPAPMSESPMTPVSAGSRVPEVVFKTRIRDAEVAGDNPFRWQDVTSEQIFKGKKVVLFGLPGAFTPTCSTTHLPGYEKHYADFKALGVDEVYCLSVNDAFVMKQWADKLGAVNVKLLPDGNADFTRGMGMLVHKRDLGFGERSWRYSMYVEDGEIKKKFVEPGFSHDCPTDPFEVSDAETMLAYLKESK